MLDYLDVLIVISLQGSLDVEEGGRSVSERCNMRHTKPAIVGFANGGRATSQGMWAALKLEKEGKDSPLEPPEGTRSW